ncbi:hypothetical protein [Caulobacter sp. 17J80-11]|uniref:hypothetical protein n=1 Tax=Caulobacter sp. 17J80-11 TaxID=2763502 RepID=UPI001653637C|nr:hypothetical protein [Caulobacter sp. 17J80-11]MBC6980709.1 hypothetical protein [Caulobacter sp. 17J80-11]
MQNRGQQGGGKEQNRGQGGQAGQQNAQNRNATEMRSRESRVGKPESGGQGRQEGSGRERER